jgi:membrane protease YdiL (CAAX protease family)
MIAGLVVVAVPLTILIGMNSAEPSVFAGLNRRFVVLVLVIGIIVFAIGLAIPTVLVPSAAAGAGGATLGSHRVILGTTLLVILISNLPPILYGLATSLTNLRSPVGFLFAALSVQLTLIGISYLRLIRSGQTTWTALGFDRGHIVQDIFRGLSYGALAFLVSALLQSVLDLVGVRQTQLRELSWIRDLDLTSFLVMFLVGAIGAPLAEELYFRGYVFAAYLREKGPVVAYVLSSLVFAGLHLNREALLPIFVLGFMLAWMYHRSNSIILPITAHAFNNGLAFLIFYFGPRTIGQ